MSVSNHTFQSTYARIVGPVGLLLAACVVSISALIYVATLGQDENAIDASVHLADTAMDGRTKRLAALSVEIAYWDEAVENTVTHLDPIWADDELGEYLTGTYNVDGVYVVGTDDIPIYSSVDGERGTENPLERFDKGLPLLMAEARAGSKSAAPIPQTGFVTDGENIYIAAVATMTTYEGERDIGTDALLLIFDVLDDDRLRDIGDNYLLPDLTVTRSPGNASARLPIIAPDGRSLGYFIWNPDLPGSRIFPVLIMAVGVAGIVIASAWILFLRRTRAFSEQLAAEATSHAQMSELLRSTLDSVDHGIAAWDKNDKLLIWNAKCEDFWYHPAHIETGMPKRELLRHIGVKGGFGEANPFELAERRYEQLKVDGANSGDSFQLLDGRRISVHRFPLPSGGHTSVYSDVTESFTRERELETARNVAEDANQAKSRFIANISHELRTPLNAILGYSEFMLLADQDHIAPEQKSKEYLEAIYGAGGNLLHAINQILDLAKIESGKINLTAEDIEVSALIEASSKLVYAQRLTKQIELTVHHPDTRPLLHADRVTATQILNNLLSNAVKFTPEKGEISVSYGLRSGRIFICVTDNGIGIAPDMAKRIMEPFAQIVDVQEHPQEGTGLGLSIVKSLVELHNGEIEMVSEPGCGTSFTVLFPPERTVPTASMTD